ncbi:MAG: LacI family DNA-binding transcriptional regulator [Caldilinea sp.]
MRRKQEVTILDVATAAGLSPSTVSRVLNQKGYYSAENEQKVRNAVESLGYRPSWSARSLKGAPTRVVGLIIPDISNVFYTTLAGALLTRMRVLGYDMILCVNDENAQLDLNYLEMLQQKGVDGILYTHPAHGNNSAHVRRMVEKGMPIVELNRQREKNFLDAVLPDNFRGVHQAVEYLANLGHRRIGFISGSAQITTGHERLLGYQSAVRLLGLDDDPALLKIGSFTRQHGEQAMTELLALPNRPTALIAGSNRISMGALMVMGQAAIRIPDDMSVIGYNDTEWLTAWNPPITAVDIAVDEMAQLAIDLLHRRVIGGNGGDGKPVTYHLSTSLIIRQSCRKIEPSST